MRAIHDAQMRKQVNEKREQFYTDTTNRMGVMEKTLNELMSMSKKRDELRAQRRANYGAATIGQQGGVMGAAADAAGLRISQGGMSPSARRRMRRAG